MGEWTVETPSTCTQQGTEQRKCNNCDYTEQRKAALAQHTHKTVEGKKATCTETGLTDGIVCEVCGKEIVSQTEVSALGHKYDEGKVTEPATCLKDGEITYTCENCGDTKTETIKTEGHKYVVEGYVAPSCTYAGYTGDKTCEVCKDFIKGEMIPAGYGLRGDVNNDGKINAVDATQILRYCNNKASVLSEEMTEEELRMLEFIADVNCDGKINAIDATQILRECNNKASVFDQYETVKEAEICQLHKDIMDKLAKENQ